MDNTGIIATTLIGGCLIFAGGCQDASDAELRKAVTSGDCPGYVSYSLEFGREEWSCFGWADVESERQMDTRTVFRICSMTKSFVGALAAVLADCGAIDLDDPISRTFPEFTGEKKDITLRQCLSMTAGFAEMSPIMLKKGINSQDPSEVAREMAGLPLMAIPGTKFKYSNPSFEIAGAVIEKITGHTLQVMMEDVFFKPLEMYDTTFYPSQETLSRMAVLYCMNDAGGCCRGEDKILAPAYIGKFTSASGGLFSTPEDILKFYQMLLRGGFSEDGRRIMPEGAIKILTTKQTPETVSTWYSLGFFRGKEWFGHGGAYGTIAECDLANFRLRMIFTQIRGTPARSFLRIWRKATNESFGEEAWGGNGQVDERASVH